MSELTCEKHKAVIVKFHELYNVRRKRLDDSLKETAEQYFLSQKYVYKLIFYVEHNYDYYVSISDPRACKQQH